MEFNKTLNSTRSILWGWVNRIVKIFTPFLFRTLLIKKLGIEYLGINSLFNSILGLLSLAELGFDAAVVSIMYKYIADNMQEEICAILKFLKNVYLCIGVIVLFIGACLIPFLPFLIKDMSAIPSDVNVYFIYIIFLVNSSVSYFFGGYKNSLFNAYQRVDIISNVYTVILLLSFGVQVFIILIFEDYSLYIITMPLFTILNNLCLVLIANKQYPFLKPHGKIAIEIKIDLIKKVKGLFFAKVGSVLSFSFDNLIISSFLGITILAKYTNYCYLVSGVEGFLVVINTSLQPVIGNLVYTKSIEENFDYLKKLTFIYNWLVSFCSVCFIMLEQTFINIWLGIEYQLPVFIIYSLTFSFYVSTFDSILGIYKAARGIWWEDRYRCFIAGIVNLILNYGIAVILQKYNPYYVLLGVSISTFLSQAIIGTPWATIITFKIYFKDGLKQYIKELLQIFVVSCIVGIIVYYLWFLINNYFVLNNLLLTLILKFLFTSVVFNGLMFICFYKTRIFKESLSFMLKRFS